MKWVLSLFLLGLIYLMVWSCDTHPYQQGRNLYLANCASCHMNDGSGLKSLYPPLTVPAYLSEKADKIPCTIRYGIRGKLKIDDKEYNSQMAGHPSLNVTQISNIINYIRNAWGNELGHYPEDSVRMMLKRCSDREVIE